MKLKTIDIHSFTVAQWFFFYFCLYSLTADFYSPLVIQLGAVDCNSPVALTFKRAFSGAHNTNRNRFRYNSIFFVVVVCRDGVRWCYGTIDTTFSIALCNIFEYDGWNIINILKIEQLKNWNGTRIDLMCAMQLHSMHLRCLKCIEIYNNNNNNNINGWKWE